MKEGKKVGITAGAFDLCHAGHILMFQEAKGVCDYLIVLLHEDPSLERPEKHAPVMSLKERIIILEAIRYVDEVVPYKTEKDLRDLLISLKPDVRIIGADWKGKEYTGHELPIPVYFNSRDHGFSSTELRKRIYEAELKRMRT